MLKISIIFLLFSFEPLFADNICGDWQTYEYEKCFKLVETVQSYDEATNTCQQYNSTLVTINSSEEQQFIENYLFTKHNVIENVWIGLKYFNSKFKWINDFEANYTNWSENSPQNLADYCVQIDAYYPLKGKWSDILCAKKNFAFCEKISTITIKQFIEITLNTSTQLANCVLQQNVSNTLQFDTIKQLNTTNNELLSKLIKLENTTYELNSKLENTSKQLNDTTNELLITNNKLANTTKQLENAIQQLNIRPENKTHEIELLVGGNNIKTFVENNVHKAFVLPEKSQAIRSTHQHALEVCEKYNATLVEIESFEKQTLVESFLHQIEKTQYWTGGYRENTVNGTFKWLSSGHEFNYTNWVQNPDPNTPFTNIYGIPGELYGKWLSTTISDHNNILCEIVLT